MALFNVYTPHNITPESGKGSYVYDSAGNSYLDFYGGHAAISVGHTHPHYVKTIQNQLNKIGFYSNAVMNPLQVDLSDKLNALSGLTDYQIFYSNSGAEAVENALKIASKETGKNKVLCFQKGFHGRTSAAASVTDMAKAQFPIFDKIQTKAITLNDEKAMEEAISTKAFGAVIIEAIQGWSGIYEADKSFLIKLEKACKAHDTLLIVDEIQAGYGRTGDFFAFQSSGIQPDIICCAKGMGNGFPIAGTLFHKSIAPQKGSLGSTFGGNHLAMAAGNAVLDIIKKEKLLKNVADMNAFLKLQFANIPQIKSCRGRGLLLGLEFDFKVKELVQHLLFKEKVFVGTALNKNTLRLLPPLNINKMEAEIFCNKLKNALQTFQS